MRALKNLVEQLHGHEDWNDLVGHLENVLPGVSHEEKLARLDGAIATLREAM